MQMLKKLFNSDSKYYLQLDEARDSEVVKTAKETTKAVKEKVAEVSQSVPVQEAVKTAGKVVETAQDKIASVIPESASENSTEEKSSKKKSVEVSSVQNKSAKNGKVAESEGSKKAAKAAPQNSGASSYDPPFWVAAMSNTNNGKTNSNGQVAEQTFASDNLMPTITKYRRRPGGSLAKFKDMAKIAKTPRK